VDRTASCRRIACLIGDDLRLIELVEAIHSFGESRLRQCVNQNSGRLVVANRRFNHRTPRLPRLTEASGFRADYGLSGQMPSPFSVDF
jgi:hypothetical protein